MAWLWKSTEECVITLDFDYPSFGAVCSIAITWRHSSGHCLMAHWPSFPLHTNLLLLLSSQKTELQHITAQVLSSDQSGSINGVKHTFSCYDFTVLGCQLYQLFKALSDKSSPKCTMSWTPAKHWPTDMYRIAPTIVWKNQRSWWPPQMNLLPSLQCSFFRGQKRQRWVDSGAASVGCRKKKTFADASCLTTQRQNEMPSVKMNSLLLHCHSLYINTSVKLRHNTGIQCCIYCTSA